jgi:flavin-dependent dehydrogenase
LYEEAVTPESAKDSVRYPFGDGWALVGDAAFFIDPCYSSVVHLALSSAREAARLYLESKHLGKKQVEVFRSYEVGR